jgi:hypothetical protein
MCKGRYVRLYLPRRSREIDINSQIAVVGPCIVKLMAVSFGLKLDCLIRLAAVEKVMSGDEDIFEAFWST